MATCSDITLAGQKANDDLVLIHAKAIEVLRRFKLTANSTQRAKAYSRTRTATQLGNLRKLYAAVLMRRETLRLDFLAARKAS